MGWGSYGLTVGGIYPFVNAVTVLGLKNDGFTVHLFLNGLQIFSINIAREVKLSQN